MGINLLDMQVTEQEWKTKMQNLMERRELGTIGHSAAADLVRDYKTHLSKVFIGKTVLDIGAGDCVVKQYLPEGTTYHPMDAFPVADDILQMEVESPLFQLVGLHDTLIAFVVMDGVRDFDQAIENMKQVAWRNIVFLTGVNIPPDKYHTIELKLSDFDYRFSDWKKTYSEEIVKNVWLLEYTRP